MENSILTSFLLITRINLFIFGNKINYVISLIIIAVTWLKKLDTSEKGAALAKARTTPFSCLLV